MSGVDAVRGFNYQHCHAVLIALEVAMDPDLAGIRVEGDDEALDIEVHSIAGPERETVLVRGFQVKSRKPPYTWGKADLLAILRRWVALPMSASSEFIFLTDGKIGPSGREVQTALEAARLGDFERIAELLGVTAVDPLCGRAGRTSILSEPGSEESLFAMAETEVRAQLADGPNHPDAVQDARVRVNNLLRLVMTRSALSDSDERFISRKEIHDELGGVSHLSPRDRWARALGGEYDQLAAAEDSTDLVAPRLCTRPEGTEMSVSDLSDLVGPLVLTGRTGSGKSTVARLWRMKAAAVGSRVVVCHAETYLARQLDRSVADSVGYVVGRELPRMVGRQVLGDPDTTVLIDGTSEVPAEIRSALAEEVRHHLAKGHGARLGLIGRDESVCASLFPSTVEVGRVYPDAFDDDERLDLVRQIFAETRGEDRTVEHSPDPGGADYGVAPERVFTLDRECREALMRVENVLDDAAGNPMLLRLATELIADGIEFSDRASIYRLTIDRMGARKNSGDLSIASAALGLVFSALLDDGKRYARPLEWARHFNAAVLRLDELGITSDANAVHDAVQRSGLISAVMRGIGPTSVRGPIHDSFADYFAAYAHSTGLVELTSNLVENDENRVLLSSQMRQLPHPELLRVARQLPFSMVRLSESDSRQIDDETPQLIANLLGSMLPELEPVKVTMWRDGDDRAIAQFGTTHLGWVALTNAPGVFDGLTVFCEADQGPVLIAVRLWRRILLQRLRRDRHLPPSPPQTVDEACEQLTHHFKAVERAGEQLIPQVASPEAVDRLARTVGPLGVTGVVYQEESEFTRSEPWVVRYTRTRETVLQTASGGGAPPESAQEEFAAFADAKSTLSTSPKQAAAKRVSDAINQLTRSNWL